MKVAIEQNLEEHVTDIQHVRKSNLEFCVWIKQSECENETLGITNEISSGKETLDDTRNSTITIIMNPSHVVLSAVQGH